MKKLILVSVALLVIAGCLPDSAQMQTFTEKVTLLSSKVDSYQAEMGDVIGLLEADNLINEKIVAKIDKANEEIDRIQPQITDVAKAIKNADYISGDDVGNIIKAAKVGTAATAPWNPYATMIIIGLTILETITALFLKKKSGEATVAEDKRDADKAGREKTLREIAAMDEHSLTAPVVKSLMYSNIGEARRAIT